MENNLKPKPIVIAISGVSGGGKTTITRKLKEILKLSKSLHFDDYDFERCPDDISEWVKNGASLEEWDLTPFLNDLKKVALSPNLDYILLDYPFARLHREVGRFIDFTIFINTPLDIAMARRILRDFSGGTIEQVRNNLNHYLTQARLAYLDMRNKHEGDDFIVDGSLTVDQIVGLIAKRIKDKNQKGSIEMIIGIHHAQITIPKGKENEARSFYCRILNLKEISKPESLQGRGGFWVEVGDGQLHIGTEEGVDRTSTKAHIAYEVEDINTIEKTLKDHGIDVIDSIPIPGYERFEFRDPFGNRVECIKPLKAPK